MSDSIQVALIVVIGWVISVCFHEFAHALVAYIGGDKSVKSKGYLTFNPFLYSDIRYSVLLPTFFVLIGGIGLPGAAVRIQSNLLRHPYWMSLVSFAGPFATFLWILGMIAVIHSGVLPAIWALAFCWLLKIEIVVLLLNLLPIPGLDGFGIIEPFLSKETRKKIEPMYKHGFTIMLVLLWLIPGPNELLWELGGYYLQLAGVPLLLAYQGHELYSKGAFPVAGTVLVLAAIAYYINNKRDWFTQALKLMEKGDFQVCIDSMKKVIEKKPDTRAYRLIALSYYELAKRIEEGNEQKKSYLKEALDAANKAIELESDSPENLLSKALICAETSGLDEQALDAFNKCIAVNPHNAYAQEWKCHMLYVLNRFEELLPAAESGLKEFPDSKPLLEAKRVALFAKSTELFHAGKYEESLAITEQLISMGYELRTNYYNKACCLAKLNRNSEALESLSKAADLDVIAIEEARKDSDLSALWELDGFRELVKKHEAAAAQSTK